MTRLPERTTFTIDVVGADSVDLTVAEDPGGCMVWLNINGQNVLRATHTKTFQIDDRRYKPIRTEQS